MNRKFGIWMSCLFLVVALCWQSVGCGTGEVKPGENKGETGGSKDAGTVDNGTADNGTVDNSTADNGTADNGVVDNGTVDSGPKDGVGNPDTGPVADTQPDLSLVDTPPASPIKMEFTPKSGATIDVKDFCISVSFSQVPSKKGWSAKWQIKGETTQVPVVLTFDQSDDTKATLCALVYLLQDTEYEVELTIKDKSQSILSKEKATYKTKAPYATEKPADPGISTNMTLTQLVSPAGLAALLGGLQPDQLVPILAHLHKKDSGKKGQLVYIGAAGKAPAGGKPHQGKDIVDNVEPSSAVLDGTFSGRWFSVSSPNFFFSAGNLSLTLEQFQLTGLTSTDGKRVDEGSFTAIVDAETVKKQFGIDICLLLVGECFKGPKGRDLIRFAGRLKGVANPLPFSAFLPKPQRMGSPVGTKPKVEYYLTEAISAATDVTLQWESCVGSTDAQTPCDTAKGAKITTLSIQGTTALGPNKLSGIFTPTTALPAATWIRLKLSAKNASNNTATSFTLFQTQ